ncbi:MAG: hypothetical protein RJA36_3565 [Pseudomonadota bacterium]|jgi:hypothetical protein
MACSATKNPAEFPISARHRYTGPVWQTLKAADPTGELAHVMVLSAKHGLIDASELIENYDQKMTNERGRELLEQGLTADTRVLLAELSGHGRSPFSEICIVGGHLYQAVAQELVREAAESMYHPPFTADVRIVEICDEIGYMRQKLRAWLQAGAAQEAA